MDRSATPSFPLEAEGDYSWMVLRQIRFLSCYLKCSIVMLIISLHILPVRVYSCLNK